MTNQPQPNPHSAPQTKPEDRVWLIAVAAPRELEAVLRAIDPGFDFTKNLPEQWALCPCGMVDVVYTGVGKASAAGGVARVLDPARHIGVLSVGIAGAMKGTKENTGCSVLDVVCADSSAFADEGVSTSDAFISCAELGFAPFDVTGVGSDSLIHNEGVLDWLAGFSDHVGTIACVSMCSGTNELAEQVVVRIGAIAEAMEGAAVCLAAHRIDRTLLTGELRVISNLTGDRNDQQWDLDGALSKLTQVLGRVIDTLE